jgi:hypothetical protein
MKKLLLIMGLITTISYSQIISKFKPYVSLGVAISSDPDYVNGSSPSIEVGVIKENVSFGLCIGRNTFDYKGDDKLSNYCYEVKGILNGSVILGAGQYFKSSGTFIEYGFGLSYDIKNISYGIAYSNFDRVDFISPSITYIFN